MAELKPCPFCGETNLILAEDSDPGYWKRYYIRCTNCGARGGSYRPWRRDGSALKEVEEKAAELWNRRAGVKNDDVN